MPDKKLKNAPAYSYVLHWNPYTNRWNAILRQEYVDQWNGKSKNSVKGKDGESADDLIKRLKQ